MLPSALLQPAETASPSFGCIKVVETSAFDIFYPNLNASIVTELPFKTLAVPLIKLRMTPETGRLGIKKERRDGRGDGREDRMERRERQMTSF